VLHELAKVDTPPETSSTPKFLFATLHTWPITRLSRAASTAALVISLRWLISRIRWIWVSKRFRSRKLPPVARMIAAMFPSLTASAEVLHQAALSAAQAGGGLLVLLAPGTHGRNRWRIELRIACETFFEPWHAD